MLFYRFISENLTSYLNEQERRAGIWTESVDARDRRRTSETKETNEK